MQAWNNELEVGWGYKLSKPSPSDTLPLAMLCFLRFQRAPPAGDQTFEIYLWGHFLFRPHRSWLCTCMNKLFISLCLIDTSWHLGSGAPSEGLLILVLPDTEVSRGSCRWTVYIEESWLGLVELFYCFWLCFLLCVYDCVGGQNLTFFSDNTSQFLLGT